MNREIKFRVWTGSEMVYDVVVGIEGAFYATVDENDSDCLSSTTKYHSNNPVMQYTGLEDKNNEPIYEGDIIICSNGTKVLVEYQANHGGFILKSKWSKNQHYINLSCDIAFESFVAGNIFQHSYLLK